MNDIEILEEYLKFIKNFDNNSDFIPALENIIARNKELEEEDNGVEFFIGYLKAGTLLFNQLTGDDKNNLEFTHILNQLCVQDLLKGTDMLKEE